MARFEALLASDEKQRADRFRFDHLRRSFILTRGALRALIGRYIGVSPANIVFSYGTKGKPAVESSDSIDFNVSHSGDFTVVAFAHDRKIGVDVERIRPVSDLTDIAARFFCPEEFNELMSVPAEHRDRAFFLCWTRKEAYIKAKGAGLSIALNDFRVTLQPGLPAAFIRLEDGQDMATDWSLHNLELAPDFAAALAYAGNTMQLIGLPVADVASLLPHS